MSVQQAVEFLRLLQQRTGRKGAIYSGDRLKETIGQLSADDRDYLCSHRLWLCEYGPRAVLPEGFSKFWLWQYTGDGIGLPRTMCRASWPATAGSTSTSSTAIARSWHRNGSRPLARLGYSGSAGRAPAGERC